MSISVLGTAKKHYKLLVAIGIVIAITPMIIILTCYQTISPFSRFMRTQGNAEHVKVGLVLGAGVSPDGKPFDELKARLNVAADALNAGVVETLLVSGDNRFVNYNEPYVMKQYLINERHISEEKIVADYAGRSTYESCERAIKIFQVNKLIIFSANSHLPRAIYLCRHFGIEAYGIPSGVEANNSTRRELLARVKAVYNAQLSGEDTVLGDPIPIN